MHPNFFLGSACSQLLFCSFASLTLEQMASIKW